MAALFGIQCQLQPAPRRVLTHEQWALVDASIDGVLRADIAAVVAEFHDVAGPRLSLMPTGKFALTVSELIKLETYALQIAWPLRLHGFTSGAVPGPVATDAQRTKYTPLPLDFSCTNKHPLELRRGLCQLGRTWRAVVSNRPHARCTVDCIPRLLKLCAAASQRHTSATVITTRRSHRRHLITRLRPLCRHFRQIYSLFRSFRTRCLPTVRRLQCALCFCANMPASRVLW